MAKNLILQLLDIDPNKRPSTAQILKDPWMQGDIEGNMIVTRGGQESAQIPDTRSTKSAVERTLQAFGGFGTFYSFTCFLSILIICF
eukprot:m.57451 g.57451  ORF g.57451 m.57451 type:complete len:87 (+) comp11110_c0_seq1:2107-2367(+)